MGNFLKPETEFLECGEDHVAGGGPSRIEGGGQECADPGHHAVSGSMGHLHVHDPDVVHAAGVAGERQL